MKRIITLIIALCATFSLLAQNSNLKREVLFTLGENEEIYGSEYFAAQYLNQNRFACIVRDTLKKTYTFVFNGKLIITINDWIRVNYLNVNEENGYIFYYHKEEEGYYVNCKGVEDGSFEDVSFNPSYYKLDYDGDYDFFYKLAGRWYVHKDGRNKLIPQKENNKTKNEISFEREKNKYYVTINGVRIPNQQGYDMVYDYLKLTESGKYAYMYRNNGKSYVNINGKSSQGYDDVYGDVKLTESGKYAYKYSDNDKYYVNINGTIHGAYDDLYSHANYPFYINDNGDFSFYYYLNGTEYKKTAAK